MSDRPRVIDMHAHLGDFPGFVSGGERTAEMLVGEWDAAGIDAGLISILDPHDMSGANDRTRAACEAFPGRIFGYVYLYLPDVEGSLRELDRCASVDCFRGVKLHPSNDVFYPFFDGFSPVYERIEQLGLPTLWHSGTTPFSHPLQIASVARRFPGSTHVLAHFGIAELSWECAPASELADNVVVDTSINPVIGLMNDYIERFGAERMLWGSDYPWYHVRYELLKLQFLGRTDEQRRLIGGGNAERVFGI
jgi:predicted TIM-barrel fold metal-dependent hydrolase